MKINISVFALYVSILFLGGCLTPISKGTLLDMKTGGKMDVTFTSTNKDKPEGIITVRLPTGETLSGPYLWGQIERPSSSTSVGGMISPGGAVSPIVMVNPWQSGKEAVFVTLKSKSGVIGIRCYGGTDHGECEGLINGIPKYRGFIQFEGPYRWQ